MQSGQSRSAHNAPVAALNLARSTAASRQSRCFDMPEPRWPTCDNAIWWSAAGSCLPIRTAMVCAARTKRSSKSGRCMTAWPSPARPDAATSSIVPMHLGRSNLTFTFCDKRGRRAPIPLVIRTPAASAAATPRLRPRQPAPGWRHLDQTPVVPQNTRLARSISPVAQSVEQVTVNHWVGGSSPVPGSHMKQEACSEATLFSFPELKTTTIITTIIYDFLMHSGRTYKVPSFSGRNLAFPRITDLFLATRIEPHFDINDVETAPRVPSRTHLSWPDSIARSSVDLCRQPSASCFSS